MSLKLVFHISEDSSIIMDSPDQGAYDIPCETVFLSADSINLSIPKQTSNAWMRYFMAYLPAKDMKNIKIPTLIIYGGKDTQVPATLNAPKQYVPGATVNVYPYANHLMQHSSTGQVEEYKLIEETFSPEILNDIARFIISL